MQCLYGRDFLTIRGPNWKPDAKYYDCRYAVLREPLGFARGAEILQDDAQALHAFVIKNETVVSVGRAHQIPETSDGSQADHAGPGAAQCPPFSPLISGGPRPAIQIRQMGTRSEYQRQGLASKVLAELEQNSIDTFGAVAGFLQARMDAVPFYQSQGWEIIDEEYDIKGIGPHRSMMKRFVKNQ